MIYLIPAWYKQNSWNECEQCWYIRRTKSEYDDTVKQMQLFHRNKSWHYKLLILSFMPNLRHFLHRQGMYRANYWSCFDSMMEIRRNKIGLFSFKDLRWPEGICFEYTPFAVCAYLHGDKYAQIEFGEDGNLIKVDTYKNSKLERTNLYDDRGFVASSIVYDEGKPIYQDYLMENGVWKLRMFFDDEHVEVNSKYNHFVISNNDDEYSLQYKKLIYQNIDEVIQEVFEKYITLVENNDIFCVAAHNQHMHVIKNAMKNKKVILSFFEKRLSVEQLVSHDLSYVDYVVADSYENLMKYKNVMGSKIPITDITPYDTRVDYGISQQMERYKVLIPIDNIDENIIGGIIRALTEYMEENQRVEVHFFTRYIDYDTKQKILSFTRNVLIDNGRDERMALELAESMNESDIDNEGVRIKFFVDQCMDELTVSKCVREQRLIIDMSEFPDVYLQVAAVSAAIPQIARRETKYLINGENGMVVDSVTKLVGTLRYYLDNLANWNEAMICASEIGKQFSTKALLRKWKEVIEKVGQN